jgi:murein DD-endopeptidase MepM/ murein hydrolase activator NlpD
VGSTFRWRGRHLAHVQTVRFPAKAGGRVNISPQRARQHMVTAKVPAGAGDGRPTLISANRPRTFAARSLFIVRPGHLIARKAVRLQRVAATPSPAFYDGRVLRIHYRFRSRSVTAVRLSIVRRATGEVVAHIERHGVSPFSAHTLRWNGSASGGGAAPAGAYALRVRLLDGHDDTAGRFRMLPFEFPVRDRHSYGGAIQRFGAPRTGGRVHQGQDVFAPCGTREVAARGGHVVAAGYDPVLYGNWLVIDGRGTRTDYRYAHMIAPSPLNVGARVRTGQSVGRVGRTGNARSVGCMLHFEEWPSGWEHGNPVDPLPDLLRWDGWS